MKRLEWYENRGDKINMTVRKWKHERLQLYNMSSERKNTKTCCITFNVKLNK